MISRPATQSVLRPRQRRLRVLIVLAALASGLSCAGCASTPPHYPSQTAEAHIGKSLFKLEMRWSTPARLHDVKGTHVATWRFNQYNYDGCSVTVHTDHNDIIQEVTWTKGCGPKATKTAKTPTKH